MLSMKEFGELIISKRKEFGYTQETLANKLRITPQAVSKWERDLSCPDINSLPTMKINNCLHKEFGVKNLNHRMIFTACALVAVKEGAILHKGTEYSLFHQTILLILKSVWQNM